MDCVAAYLLMVENKKDISKETMLSILNSINAAVSAESIDLFFSLIEGKTYEEILALGSKYMSSLCVGSAQPAQASSAVTKDVKEESAEKEESEEEVLDFF